MNKAKEPFISSSLAYVFSFFVSVFFVFLAYVFQGSLSHFRPLGLIGIFLINLIGPSTLFLPAPAIVSVVAGGLLFLPILVAMVAAFGASLGDLLGYSVGRSGKHIVLNRTQHAWYNALQKFFTKFADIVIFLFAFFPNPFFDGVGIITGISDYPVVRFFCLMLLGRFARNMLLATLGMRL